MLALSFNVLRAPLIAAVGLAWLLPVHANDVVDFPWPKGKRAAVSLTFDDARVSQVDNGLPLLDKHGVKATFYNVPEHMTWRLEGWKKAAAAGHEIANHTTRHPCTGNFGWTREVGVEIEFYTLDKIRDEMLEANRQIEAMVGIKPRSFAYPCGHTAVGAGAETRSYVPLVAKMFTTGRDWMNEAINDPNFTDFALLTGVKFDGLTFEQVLPLLKTAREQGRWLILVGHDIGKGNDHTTDTKMLEKLIRYAQDPANGIWLDTVINVADYVAAQREKTAPTQRTHLPPAGE